ncbi:bifunctional tetrahydrofolate synthase/dihydrofolate synthase [Xanthomonas rydalmerensis]|uniref:Dihydrofolate synthase/folylpolyglutamate synthase n=2 Tax=Xanthomonas rydalmerensis TaxID=3046274 RepID=A0ABZ0JT77_9XANT|nr:bifunctional tetrahydrofolate synthase/dihydrofolate synthase [Xanthomonas sp. DM-2023]WOS43032.1 bifunctional tetrahydrofolate synthase/dihydrofolate synthase [Xanthomonas sp. DM-2023]WOS47214.1 bifunctional tetrahydrofolate synthase/dihydrofolate synthase [Xanthomonas sp. DM-2023]WOS51394.1 bifunctional tetrahydrofolate synthase/dihydrofolate synthase [Xanthomonas sp. DM-2023]WOS55577.1 bifunctional tetrahydrofolate synthase/dihydrofolate synthase [Xanthomonas sp. DM-2023]WOS59757.1 bifun
MASMNTLSEWLAYIERQHPQDIAMGLERVRAVAARMRLTRPAKHVITVGGTNGKGSTVAFIEAIARAAGWRVGSYTSPHLLRYNERVRIEGEEASDADLMTAFAAVEAARGETALTYFEYGTLAALWLFQQAKLGLAVLEVGLGGRLDAVNLVDADVAVITTVDIDHTDWLGSDREAIGAEKAGIARPWKPLVLGEIDPPSSVLRRAYAIGANAIRAGSDFFHEQIDAERWRWRDVGTELQLPLPQLRAPVQRANAATAIAALRALRRSLPRNAYAEGIAAARLRGRLQPCVRDGVEVLVDVGHNPQAARELAAALQAQPVAGRTCAVFAALADKDAAGVVEALAAQVDAWHLAGLSGSRGQSSAQLRARLAGTAAAEASVAESVAQALQSVLAQARPGDRVLVFGSFHTAAEALHWLHSAG